MAVAWTLISPKQSGCFFLPGKIVFLTRENGAVMAIYQL